MTLKTTKDFEAMFNTPRFRWEQFKLAVSEFFWRFHPRRNRWCKDCDSFIGNSRAEADRHICGDEST